MSAPSEEDRKFDILVTRRSKEKIEHEIFNRRPPTFLPSKQTGLAAQAGAKAGAESVIEILHVADALDHNKLNAWLKTLEVNE